MTESNIERFRARKSECELRERETGKEAVTEWGGVRNGGRGRIRERLTRRERECERKSEGERER